MYEGNWRDDDESQEALKDREQSEGTPGGYPLRALYSESRMAWSVYSIDGYQVRGYPGDLRLTESDAKGYAERSNIAAGLTPCTCTEKHECLKWGKAGECGGVQIARDYRIYRAGLITRLNARMGLNLDPNM